MMKKGFAEVCGNVFHGTSLAFSLVGEAANGKDALNLVIKHRPDLIITDIRMPEMDGLALLEVIRSLSIHSLAIIISGYNDFQYAQQAIRYGVSDYLLKPIDENELYECILNCKKKLNLADSTAQKDVQEGDKAKNNLIVKHVMEYIDTHYNQNIGLADVANAVAVHPNYLSSLFTRVMGERFSEYLGRMRIEKSKALLLRPQLKIYEVAEMVGYSDYRWFSKLFKYYVGMSPLDYRNHRLSK